MSGRNSGSSRSSGSSASGNNYTSYGDGRYRYSNSNGSSYYKNGMYICVYDIKHNWNECNTSDLDDCD